MITYIIEGQHAGNWEPIPEGGFDTAEGAIGAMRTLEEDLGWSDMRVIEAEVQDGVERMVGVVETGRSAS